ncbi:hypothetical protein F5144DRAFT_546590 [Chaetomium tenue]|uniref:Uncharacterized protein n=1 Tax=Chaetomium tenue TaxID=1854479 RepID=A0ACB7PCJ6_9PEZI|nr:hypothetical protein F5144DRAFT_546590 [Chaetomium globosum]
MAKPTAVRKYGKATRKPTADILFAQLPRSPLKSETRAIPEPTQESYDNARESGEHEREADALQPGPDTLEPSPPQIPPVLDTEGTPSDKINQLVQQLESTTPTKGFRMRLGSTAESEAIPDGTAHQRALCTIGWADVYANGEDDGIEKIAEASFAEVYRITNSNGTSILKVIRLESPIKPQTKAQVRSGLVDEEPHSEEDIQSELRISEWLADIPGFVVYKERYVIQGKAPKALLETHQAFYRRTKRKDPDRLQFYPSPSRYLDDTRFLVVELGDAGMALEDFELTSISQVWDIFLHTALALARAERLIEFEVSSPTLQTPLTWNALILKLPQHRDLHEGNLCVRQVRPPTTKPADSTSPRQFGYSGLDVTLLDYGLSRASDPESPLPGPATPPNQPPAATPTVFADLEEDLALFESTHAPQCAVYRQMRAYLIWGDRLPGTRSPPPTPNPTAAAATANPPPTPYPHSALTNAPLSWATHAPYTNVLWLAYLFRYLVDHFDTAKGGAGEGGAEGRKHQQRRRQEELRAFRRETRELQAHLDPAAPRGVLSFPSAAEVVGFAVEAGWSPNRMTVPSFHVSTRGIAHHGSRSAAATHSKSDPNDGQGCPDLWALHDNAVGFELLPAVSFWVSHNDGQLGRLLVLGSLRAANRPAFSPNRHQ